MKKYIISIASICIIGIMNLNASEKIKSEAEIQRVKPISVPGIRYNKGLEKFSLYNPTKEGFDEFILKNSLNATILKELFNRIDNPKSIVLSAYGYDYGHQRPDLAENFYQKFDASYSIENKLRKVDFLIRTGRLDEVPNVINSQLCLSNFKTNTSCYYYIGLYQYLKTGNNKNKFLNLSKNSVKKAKEIFDGELN